MRPPHLMSGIVLVFAVWTCCAADVHLPYDSSCPVIHTNDGNIDVYTLEYSMALASAGDIRLVGIVADAGTGYGTKPKAVPKVWEEGRRMYADIVGKARRSGMVNIPDPVAGANWALDRPASGKIDDTVPLDTPGSRLIVQEARRATPEKPLVVVTGGALTCAADAYLLDNTIELASSDYDLKKKYDFRRIDIVREYDPTMPEVPCERTKIQQVFLNILKNSAQAMAQEKDEGKEPLIALRVQRDGDTALIEIEDNGPGMDDATRKRVFEPFFTTKGIGDDTGLGLSVSYFIITKNHGGTLSVESTPGIGAKFIIRLPLHQSIQ